MLYARAATCSCHGARIRVILVEFWQGAVRFSFVFLSNVSKKGLTKDVKEIFFPVPLYRAVYSAGRGQNVLSRVKVMVTPASVKTFF